MKKFQIKNICLLLSFILVFPILTLLSACKSNGNNNNNTNTHNLELSYIKNLKINMNNTVGFSIKKVPYVTSAKNTSSQNFISFNKIAYAAENNEPLTEKYVLFSTSQTYSTGNVTYNENSIEKVTFTKNETISEDVYDSNGNIISSNTTLSQEEIPGQVNRLYVFGDYTFIQFVPLLTESGNYQYYDLNNEIKTEYLEIRPNTLIYDINGVADFDKGNYYTSALSQSFIIHNTSGYIYKIENFTIENISETGIITQRNQNNSLDGYNTIYYKISIESNSLVFTDVVPNKTLSVHGVAQDKYGWVFVQNDLLDYKDELNKIIYYTHENYHYIIDKNNQVYLCEYQTGTLIEEVKSIIINGAKQAINDVTTTQVKYIATNRLCDFNNIYKGHIIYTLNVSSPQGFIAMNNSIYINIPSITNYFWFDLLNGILIIEAENYLYYKTIDIDSYINTDTILTLNDFIKLSNNKTYKVNQYYLNIDGNKKEVNNVYYTVDATSTTYYQLINNENSISLITLSDVHYSQNVYIFQPINK